MENKRSARKALRWVGIVAACLVSAVLLVGVFSMWWVMDSFAYVSMPEVVSTAMNLSGTPASSYMPYVVNTVLPFLGVAALIALVWAVCTKFNCCSFNKRTSCHYYFILISSHF